jgi:hypothetical protein
VDEKLGYGQKLGWGFLRMEMERGMLEMDEKEGYRDRDEVWMRSEDMERRKVRGRVRMEDMARGTGVWMRRKNMERGKVWGGGR